MTPILSKREQEVFNGIMEGKSFNQIGKSKGIKRGSVATYAERIYRKYHVHSSARLIVKVNNMNLIKLSRQYMPA